MHGDDEKLKIICKVYLNINITGGHKVWGAPSHYY